jgi:CheY-like chemotaxis protein
MKATVLIVDDDAEVVRTFASWLRLEGYDVKTAADGEAALEQVQGVDAIVLDARMPVLDGLGFLKRVRVRHQHVPVAIVTGDYLIDEPVLAEFHRLGAHVAFKPLWVQDLVALATGLINRTVPV